MVALTVPNGGFEGTAADAQAMATVSDIASVTTNVNAAIRGRLGLRWIPVAPSNLTLSVTTGAIDTSEGTHTAGLWFHSTTVAGVGTSTLTIEALDAAGVVLDSVTIPGPAVSQTWAQITGTQPPVEGTAKVRATVTFVVVASTTFYADEYTLDWLPPGGHAATRQIIAERVNAVEGLNATPYFRQTTKVGEAFIRLGRLVPDDSGFGQIVTWEVFVILPQDLANAEKYLDERLDVIAEAVSEVLVLRSVTPSRLQLDAGTVPVVILEGTRAN